MINKKESIIQISRDQYIEQSRAIAILKLNDKKFHKGELVMQNYYKDKDFRTDIGVLIAIGVDEGVGEDYYRLLSAGGTVMVRSVTDVIPDVSSLVHNELYIYKNPDEKWMYVYKKEDESDRTLEEITGGPYIFVDLQSGYRWFYENQVCKREDDFFSTTRIENILQINLDLSVRARKVDGTDITDKCDFYLNGTSIVVSGGRYTLENQTTSKDIEIIAKYKILDGIYYSLKNISKLRFGYNFYYGKVKSGWVPSIDAVKNLGNIKLSYRRDFKWSDIKLDLEETVLAYPKDYGYISHIYDDNSLDYIHSYEIYDTDIVIDNIRYLVYLKKDPVSVVDFSQDWVFNDSDSIVDNESNMFDIINSWLGRNTRTGGLVVLDNDGKIPESLYLKDKSDTFTKLAGIVTEYPTENMVPGTLYFNTTTNKIYTAIDDKTGVISNIKNGELYVYNSGFYSWTGTSLQKFSTLSSSVITDVTTEL
jgi:hypothetical protein